MEGKLEKRVKNIIKSLKIQSEEINKKEYACGFDEGWQSGIVEGYENCIAYLENILENK